MTGWLRTGIVFAAAVVTAAGQESISHAPLRNPARVSDRPLERGPHLFVSPSGNDDAPGTESQPFRTVGHALAKLSAGETLCLRGGIYREQVRISLEGKPDAPLTIRSYPGEEVILDGSIAEFFESPADAWEPSGEDPDRGEFRSVSSFPNLRNVLGSFGDSMIGLQTYYHAKDLRAGNEVVDWEDWENREKTDLEPLYLGPGLWYDKADGRIFLRLAHTNLPDPIPNYRGETDPRKIPLILAPFRSTPLFIDGASHFRIQDLTIRGGGYATVELQQASDIEIDNVTIWAGTYGFRATGTRGLKLINCGIYGNVAPWTFRGDGSKRDYPGRPHRNLSRLNTHASFEIESGRESSVHAFPQNDDWEIVHCEFTDAHDGPYIGSINLHFHHNLVENMQDDGLYLSPMYKRHRLEDKDPVIRIERNVFRRVLTPIAFGGPWPETRDQFYIFRNVVDLRQPVQTGRPSGQRPEPGFSTGKFMGDHGSPPWPAMTIYHNTVLSGDPQRRAPGGAFGGLRSGNPRRVFNNLFLHRARLPGLMAPKPGDDFQSDGNLYWSPDPDLPSAEKLFGKFRAAAPGSEAHSVLGDPRLNEDFVPGEGGAAADAGVAIPADWPDPLRNQDEEKPDIGAIPVGGEMFRAGRSHDSQP